MEKTEREELEKRLKKRDTLSKCSRIARDFGSDKNHYDRFDFENGTVKIFLDNSLAAYGGGEITVYYKGEQVLYANRNPNLKKVAVAIIDGFYVQTYRSGGWEVYLDEIRNPTRINMPINTDTTERVMEPFIKELEQVKFPGKRDIPTRTLKQEVVVKKGANVVRKIP